MVGASPTAGPALARLVRRVDVMVCSTSAADRVKTLAGPRVRVITDDRALDRRAIEMLATVLVQQNGARTGGRSVSASKNRHSLKEKES